MWVAKFLFHAQTFKFVNVYFWEYLINLNTQSCDLFEFGVLEIWHDIFSHLFLVYIE